MKKQLPFVWLWFALLLLLAACGSNQNNQTTPDAANAGGGGGMISGIFVEDLTTLIQALEAQGAAVAAVGVGGDSFFTSPEQQITVNGAQVQAFEFESVEDVDNAAASVNGNGTIIGTTTIDWATTPHFYRSGNLIVVYAGEQEDVLAALNAAMGEPFVVGTPMLPPGTDGTDDTN